MFRGKGIPNEPNILDAVLTLHAAHWNNPRIRKLCPFTICMYSFGLMRSPFLNHWMLGMGLPSISQTSSNSSFSFARLSAGRCLNRGGTWTSSDAVASNESSLLIARHWYSPESDSLADSMCNDPVPINRKRESKSLRRANGREHKLQIWISIYSKAHDCPRSSSSQTREIWNYTLGTELTERDTQLTSYRYHRHSAAIGSWASDYRSRYNPGWWYRPPWWSAGWERTGMRAPQSFPALQSRGFSDASWHWWPPLPPHKSHCSGTLPVRATHFVDLQRPRWQHNHPTLVQPQRQIIFQPLNVSLFRNGGRRHQAQALTDTIPRRRTNFQALSAGNSCRMDWPV